MDPGKEKKLTEICNKKGNKTGMQASEFKMHQVD